MCSSSELSDSDVSDQYAYSSDESSRCSDRVSDCEDALKSGGANSEGKATDPAVTEKKQNSKKERVPGLVYLSRIPPYMKPHKLKHLLSPYGRIGHIFLQPEGKFEVHAIIRR